MSPIGPISPIPPKPPTPPLQQEKEPEPLALQPTLALPEEPPRPAKERPEPLITNRLGLRVVGCVALLYIVAESPEGMVLIDQHAAHERVLFEQMLKRMALQDPAAQQLLFPVTLEFLPRDADFLLAQIETLQQAGVGITRFGPTAFLIDALPAMVKPRDVGEFIRTVVTDLQQEGGETRKGRRLSEEVVAKTVCRHAVKANDALKPAEWDQLVHDLLALRPALHLSPRPPHDDPAHPRRTRKEVRPRAIGARSAHLKVGTAVPCRPPNSRTTHTQPWKRRFVQRLARI